MCRALLLGAASSSRSLKSADFAKHLIAVVMSRRAPPLTCQKTVSPSEMDTRRPWFVLIG